MPRRPDLRLGRIVWANIKDPRGAIKLRPAIVVTRTNDIESDQPFTVMAVSTSYPSPPPALHVELPWHPDRRRVRTRLGKRCAAVIDWLATLLPDQIEEFAGDVPPALMISILERLAELDDPSSTS